MVIGAMKENKVGKRQVLGAIGSGFCNCEQGERTWGKIAKRLQ